ncbi:MAG: UDP-N-acetylglucosamine 2-epimerase, partial [Calditrichota bacterium]
MLRVLNVVGARPNFMKVAPIHRLMQQSPAVFEPMLLHTGQHYDVKMSKLFFEDLQMPQPDVYLGVGSGSHA